MILISRIFLLLLIFLSYLEVQAQDDWELKRNENGIEVYTRRLTDEKFKEVKIVTVLPGTPKQLVGVVMDVDKQKDWVYGIKESHLIKKINTNSLIYYNQIDLPWPFNDRDLINQITVHKDAQTGKTIIQSKSIPKHIPPKPGLVRVPHAAAHWDITPVAEKEIKVIYTFSVDPGGVLPAWLVNSLATTGPYNSFVELRKRLQEMN